jgi:hypothetical protein
MLAVKMPGDILILLTQSQPTISLLFPLFLIAILTLFLLIQYVIIQLIFTLPRACQALLSTFSHNSSSSAPSSDLSSPDHFSAPLDRHGFFISPSSALFTNYINPVLSSSRPVELFDILYPSTYYWYDLQENPAESLIQHTMANSNFRWQKKKKSLFWRGSTTGSQTNTNNWKQSHRQRLVSSLRDLD